MVAAVVVGAGLTIYAVAADSALPATGGRDVAGTALDRAYAAIETAGVVDPGDLRNAIETAPSGYRLNATLTAGERRWAVGPIPPETADDASRRVGVRVEPGRVISGRLRVTVWT
ncbi:hypothetical protein BRC83_01560 [Halobacteriales archaeon QS_1_68_17]|nr:MAG: hypothetical protein BRC83_01560 [Halobacteriales archaeon QS_1_68_17]